MKKNIILILIQDLNELLEIKEKNLNAIFLPLDFSTLLYCKKNKLNHLNPIEFLDNKLHRTGILQHIKAKKELKKSFKNFDQVQSIVFFQCYSLNSIFLVSELLNSIEKKYNIEKIFVSGWRKKIPGSENEYYCLTDIIKTIKKYETQIIFKNEKIFVENVYNYNCIHSLKTKKKIIFFTDTGYNFRKIILKFVLAGFRCVILLRKENFFLKKLLSKFFRINFIVLKKNKLITKRNKKIKINLSRKLKKFEKFLEIRANQYQGVIKNLQEKSKAISKIIYELKPTKTVLNHNFHYNTSIIELCNKLKKPVTLIGHGTVSKGSNIYEKSYQDIISSAIYSDKVTTYPIQSKIINEYFKSNKNQKFPKGNLVFSQISRRTPKYILYAVTLKKFHNTIYYGQELFYEYFRNLEYLNKLAKVENLKICVKHHPNYMFTNKISAEYFQNLKFSDKNIDVILKKTEMLISFSSSSIEDALSSKIPVILFDPWSRYKHCKSEMKKAKNKCIYYINKDKHLIKAIKAVRQNKIMNFSDYTYSNDINENIKRLVNE